MGLNLGLSSAFVETISVTRRRGATDRTQNIRQCLSWLLLWPLTKVGNRFAAFQEDDVTAPVPANISPTRLPVRSLRWSLILGAFVDLTGAVPLLLAPTATARWLGVPVEGTLDFWPTYASVFLFVLPLVYFVTAINPERTLAMIGVAIAGRIMGAVVYGYWWAPLGRPTAFAALSLMNVAFAVYYFWVLGPDGRAELRAALRPAAM